MGNKNWLDIAKTIAPDLASLLPIPGASLITKAIISGVCGTTVPEIAEDMMNEDPKLSEAVRSALIQKDKEIEIAKIEQEKALTALEFANTSNARSMQIEALKSNDIFSARFTQFLAAFFSVTGMLYIIAITFAAIPPENKDFVNTVLGFILGTLISTVVNFFFGSTHSSKEKDNSINNLLTQK